jgi:hypothetical protein
VNSGDVAPHHVLLQSEWVSYWINIAEDICSSIELFSIRNEQLKPKHAHKQEKKKRREDILEGNIVR